MTTFFGLRCSNCSEYRKETFPTRSDKDAGDGNAVELKEDLP